MTINPKHRPAILMADDDAHDVMFVERAITKLGLDVDFQSVDDGVHLVDRIHGRGLFEAVGPFRPDLLLVDINMPLLDGIQAVTLVKADPELAAIPVVMLSTSRRSSDVVRSYAAGAASYLAKPDGYVPLVALVQMLWSYWFETALLPTADGALATSVVDAVTADR